MKQTPPEEYCHQQAVESFNDDEVSLQAILPHLQDSSDVGENGRLGQVKLDHIRRYLYDRYNVTQETLSSYEGSQEQLGTAKKQTPSTEQRDEDYSPQQQHYHRTRRHRSLNITHQERNERLSNETEAPLQKNHSAFGTISVYPVARTRDNTQTFQNNQPHKRLGIFNKGKAVASNRNDGDGDGDGIVFDEVEEEPFQTGGSSRQPQLQRLSENSLATTFHSSRNQDVPRSESSHQPPQVTIGTEKRGSFISPPSPPPLLMSDSQIEHNADFAEEEEQRQPLYNPDLLEPITECVPNNENEAQDITSTFDLDVLFEDNGGEATANRSSQFGIHNPSAFDYSAFGSSFFGSFEPLRPQRCVGEMTISDFIASHHTMDLQAPITNNHSHCIHGPDMEDSLDTLPRYSPRAELPPPYSSGNSNNAALRNNMTASDDNLRDFRLFNRSRAHINTSAAMQSSNISRGAGRGAESHNGRLLRHGIATATTFGPSTMARALRRRAADEDIVGQVMEEEEGFRYYPRRNY